MSDLPRAIGSARSGVVCSIRPVDLPEPFHEPTVYLLMTLGPAMLGLVLLEHVPSWSARLLEALGRAPLSTFAPTFALTVNRLWLEQVRDWDVADDGDEESLIEPIGRHPFSSSGWYVIW